MPIDNININAIELKQHIDEIIWDNKLQLVESQIIGIFGYKMFQDLFNCNE